MEAIKIEVNKGRLGSASEARKKGLVPVEYYAKGIENQHFMVEYQTFRKAYKKSGKSTIVYLVDEQKNELPVLIHKIQYHPVTDNITHIDVMAIRKGQKITTKVPLVFVGVAPAVRELGGVLVSNRDEINIECQPQDLPHEIQVDVTKLIDFHTSITIGDIEIPDGITVLDAKNLTVMTVSAPRKEEEEAPKAAAAVEGEAAAATGEAAAATGEATKPAAAEKKAEKK